MSRAFSLIEMIVVLFIVAIGFALAIPKFSQQRKTQTLNQLSQQLQNEIQMARSQAVHHRARVILCGTLDETTCVDDWSSGHMMFIDHNNNLMLDEGDRLLRAFTGTDANIEWSGLMKKGLRFEPGAIGLSHSGHFQICQQGESRKLVLNQAGRVRVEEGIC